VSHDFLKIIKGDNGNYGHMNQQLSSSAALPVEDDEYIFQKAMRGDF
jgi:hypothetical protein